MPPTPENKPPTEPGREHLRRALAQLPTHEPDPATWPRIEAQLAADAALPCLVAALPAHAPADELWAGIAARLDAAAPSAPAPTLRTRRPARSALVWWRTGAGRRTGALAASLLVLVLAGAGWWQLRRATGPVAAATYVVPSAGLRETLTVTEEVVDAPVAPALPILAADPLESQGLAFIRRGCARQPGVCGSAEFRGLHTQLTELQAQQRELRQATRRFGSSPELAREQTRLVNLQAAVERQLINLLLS